MCDLLNTFFENKEFFTVLTCKKTCVRDAGSPPPKLETRKQHKTILIEKGNRKQSLRSHGDHAVIA